MLKEADVKYRSYNAARGYKTYWSSIGERDVKTNKKEESGINLNPDYYKK